MENTGLSNINLGINNFTDTWNGDGFWYEWGDKILNLEHITVKNCTSLNWLELPKPSESFDTSDKKYLKDINISGSSLGGRISEFLAQEAFSPTYYPTNHLLQVDVSSLVDSSGNNVPVSTYLDIINATISEWFSEGKYINFMY